MRISDWSSDVCSSDLKSNLLNAAVVAGFAACMASVIVQHARAFIAARLDEAELKDKNATITLLLREYEEAQGEWLWQIDSEGRLVHLTDRMAGMLGGEPEDLGGRTCGTLSEGGADEGATRGEE